MKLLSRFFRSRSEKSIDDALGEVRNRLDGRVSSAVMAQAEARVLRRVVQGCSPSLAAQLVITWAVSADHNEAAS
jgi:hypothetical protein